MTIKKLLHTRGPNILNQAEQKPIYQRRFNVNISREYLSKQNFPNPYLDYRADAILLPSDSTAVCVRKFAQLPLWCFSHHSFFPAVHKTRASRCIIHDMGETLSHLSLPATTIPCNSLCAFKRVRALLAACAIAASRRDYENSRALTPLVSHRIHFRRETHSSPRRPRSRKWPQLVQRDVIGIARVGERT